MLLSLFILKEQKAAGSIFLRWYSTNFPAVVIVSCGHLQNCSLVWTMRYLMTCCACCSEPLRSVIVMNIKNYYQFKQDISHITQLSFMPYYKMQKMKIEISNKKICLRLALRFGRSISTTHLLQAILGLMEILFNFFI